MLVVVLVGTLFCSEAERPSLGVLVCFLTVQQSEPKENEVYGTVPVVFFIGRYCHILLYTVI